MAAGDGQEAEEHFRAAIETAEALGGAGRHLLVEGLKNLSALLQVLGNDTEAQTLYERSMDVFWGVPSAEPDSGVGNVMEAFSDVLALGAFQDGEFDTALDRYTAAIRLASIDEKLYWAMSDILAVAGLTEQAELTLTLGVEEFPDSMASLRQLADQHLNSGKVRQGLEEFERAILIEPGRDVDPILDEIQKSYFYQRIGDAYGRLVLYGDAVEAYHRALEIDPGNPGARFELGILHYVNNRFEEALLEYKVILDANPRSVDVLYRVAQAQLGLNRFSEAVEVSRSALRIQPDHRRSRYVLGTSLIRMGRTQEGRTELVLFGESEEAAGTDERLSREVNTLNTGARIALMKGQYERAMELCQAAIDAHPDVPLFRLTLASIESRLDLHEAALATLRTIVDLGLSDDSLLHMGLAREYEIQGDSEASQRHRMLYLHRLDAWLRSALD